ncbi:MAG: altronate dehydratase [Hyphomonadaceae bacterium]|nr:altronate dehydratase [Hyphomonadaceae bacterium]
MSKAVQATIRLAPEDNVVVARVELEPGVRPPGENCAANAAIPAGHKLAVRAIATGEPIIKYGQIIGFAASPIAPGDHVHVHNVEMRAFERSARSAAPKWAAPSLAPVTFQGYPRSNGKFGTRNCVAVIATVNCASTVVRQIGAAFSRAEDLRAFPNVDGVAALAHTSGCGMQAGGPGHAILKRVIEGYAAHPNVAGALLVGLGCEVNQTAAIIEDIKAAPHANVRAMNIQEAGGTRSTVDRGVAIVREMLEQANAVSRQEAPASQLALGLQCGGSDGYSGIGANPALGVAADLLVAAGGTAILSETPEIYGAEHLLIARARSEAVAEKLRARIEWWQDYVARNRGELNNNPSPGNKAGGLTTIMEKALGSAAKGGSSPLVDVYEYAERLCERGFVFMDSPGYDPASATGQIASGANLVCFTTGRGSVFGSRPAPCVKVATNTPMYDRMREDMDVNCGRIIDGSSSVAEMGQEIFNLLLAVASGERTKSELLGFGDEEFVPWQIGAVM